VNKISAITNDAFTINFIVSNKCNYNCKYCPASCKDGTTPFVSADEYVDFFSNVILDNPQIKNYKRKIVTLTGGEPSIYPEIEKILKFFKLHDFKINMISNGSAKADFWIKNSDYIDTLCLSYHPRYAVIEKIDAVVRHMVEQNKKVVLQILMDTNFWDKAVAASNFFRKYDAITINHKAVQKKFGIAIESEIGQLADYTEEQIAFIQNEPSIRNKISENYARIYYENGESEIFDGQKIIINKLNHFKGFLCGAGQSSLVIKQTGRVTGSACCASSFGFLTLNKKLRIKLFDKKITCQKEICNCVYDQRLEKKSPTGVEPVRD
jgi:organic radical activating enzyme